MKHYLTTAVALLLALSLAPQTSAQTQQERLQQHLYFLASDSLQGRKAGTEYSAKAAEYLIGQYESMGLKPFSAEGWKMPFTRPEHTDANFFNIVGIIEGNDPTLKEEYIVLGAHFDHLGTRSDGTVFNGADDNASGSTALVEITRQLLQNRSQIKRSIIIAGFDGEEMGLYGSYALAAYLNEHELLPKVRLMMSIDMVGWYGQAGALEMEGVGTILNGQEGMEAVAQSKGIKLHYKKFENSLFTATDTQGFAEKGVATLAVTTGTKSPYHKPGDDAELIDYEGLDKICNFLSNLTLQYAADAEFAPSGKVAPKHSNRLRRFSLGLMAGIGSSNIKFPQAAFDTKSDFSFDAGLTAWLNLSRRWAFRVDGIYEHAKSEFPVETNLYGSRGKFSQSAITAPAYIVLQTSSDVFQKFFVGLGGFYRHVLDTEYTNSVLNPYPVEENQAGFAATLGFTVGNFGFNIDMRSNIGSMFTSPGPKGRMFISTASLVRYF